MMGCHELEIIRVVSKEGQAWFGDSIGFDIANSACEA